MQVGDIPLHEMNGNIIVKEISECTRFNLKGIHRHTFHELLYFTNTKSEAVHSIDFTELPVRTDCVYLLKPGQVYHMEVTDQKGYLLAVNAGYLNSLYANYDHYLHFALPNIVEMEVPDLKVLEQIVGFIKDELSGLQRPELLAAYLKTIITQCLLSFSVKMERSGVDNRVLTLIALIDRHFLEEREIAFYAERILLSEKRLGVLTKKALGMTVKQLIQRRLLLEAKRLISYGDLPLKGIAFRLGFGDASYFSRFFKTYSGVTPEQFKLSLGMI